LIQGTAPEFPRPVGGEEGKKKVIDSNSLTNQKGKEGEAYSLGSSLKAKRM